MQERMEAEISVKRCSSFREEKGTPWGIVLMGGNFEGNPESLGSLAPKLPRVAGAWVLWGGQSWRYLFQLLYLWVCL